jgi:putative endonuclease
MKAYYVYIMANISRMLYIGITNNIERRVDEHKQGLCDGYTRKYRIKKLVYYEYYDDPRYAIAPEKQLKGWLRARKVALIEAENPKWKDLGYDWYHQETGRERGRGVPRGPS